MPIFTINFFLIFIWGLLLWVFIRDPKKRKLTFLSIIFIQFTYLAWQRDFAVGQDTLSYHYIFERISDRNFSDSIFAFYEPLYSVWNWIIAQLGCDFHTYLLITGPFINFAIIRFIYKFSNNVWLSVVIYVAFGFYFQSLFVLRQYMAISLILYAYEFMLDRKLLPFILLVVAATFFHYSALFFLPTYFIANKRFNSVDLLIFFSIAIGVAFLFGGYILRHITLITKYADVYLGDESSAGSGYGMLILLIGIMIVGFINKPKKPDSRVLMFYWTFFIGTCLQSLATQVAMVSREILYWVMSATIFIPIVINVKDVNIRYFYIGLTTVCLICFFLFITNAGEGTEVWNTYRWYNEHSQY